MIMTIKENYMTVYDVVKKLIGEIEPVGETNTDNKRYENLTKTIELVDLLIDNIIDVSVYSARTEHSMNKVGKKAAEYLLQLSNGLDGYI